MGLYVSDDYPALFWEEEGLGWGSCSSIKDYCGEMLFSTEYSVSSLSPRKTRLAPSHISPMRYLQALACALALAPASVFAAPQPSTSNSQVNPYIGKDVYANKGYAKKLEETIQFFNQKYDFYNAAKTKTVQKIPTFAWISKSADVSVCVCA